MKKISLTLCLFFLFYLLPFDMINPSWKDKNQVKALALSREDFKKFKGKVVAGWGQTVVLRENGTVVIIKNSYSNNNVSYWKDIVEVSADFERTVGLKKDGTVLAAGINDNGECNVGSWKDIVSVSSGGSHTVGLKRDGTVVAVGSNNDGQCNVNDWTEIVAISAKTECTVGLKKDGTVVAVGNNRNGQCNVNGWKDIVEISAGSGHTVGLKSDGTVVATGSNYFEQCDVSDWKDIVSVSAGGNHTVGLKSDGTVVAAGDNYSGQCNVSEWKGMISVSAGGNHTVGVKSDGKIIAVGNNQAGQCNVGEWRNIQRTVLGGYHGVGLKSDGSVVATGDGYAGQCDVRNWSNIVSIAVGYDYTVGLKNNGTVVTVGNNNNKYNVDGWKDIVAISSGYYNILGVKNDGTVIASGNNEDGQCNVGDWKDIIAISAGARHTVGLKKDGTVVATGNNGNGECNVSEWNDIEAISVGYDHTVGLKKDGTVVATGSNYSGQCNINEWKDIIEICATNDYTVGLKKDGKVIAAGYLYFESWGESINVWEDIISISASASEITGIKKDGTIVATSVKRFRLPNIYPMNINYTNIEVDKKIIKPNESIIIKAKDSNPFYTMNNPTIKLTAGASENTIAMSDKNGVYEGIYKAKADDCGNVNALINGTTDLYGNNLIENNLFKVIPLKAITSSKAKANPGDVVTVVLDFYKSVKPNFKIWLEGAVSSNLITANQVPGSNGLKYVFSYKIPIDTKEGQVDVKLSNVLLDDGTIFQSYTENNVFEKENKIISITDLFLSKTLGKIGDEIEVIATFSEPVKPGISINFNGSNQRTYTMTEVPNSNGTKYKCNYYVNNGEEGTIGIKISNVYDLNGILCSDYSKENVFTVDGNLPSVTVTSSIANGKLNDVIRIRALFSEPVTKEILFSLSGGINLKDAVMNEVKDSQGKEFYYDYTVKEGDEGAVDVSFKDIKDIAGNTTTLNAYNIFNVDGNIPYMTSFTTASKKYNVGDYAQIVVTFNEAVKPDIRAKFTDGRNHEEYELMPVVGSNNTQYQVYYEVKDSLLGYLDFTISNVKDMAGNLGTVSQRNAFLSGFDRLDIRKDNKIDTLDLATLAQYYNIKYGDKEYKEIVDLNKDKIIDIYDLIIISRNIE